MKNKKNEFSRRSALLLASVLAMVALGLYAFFEYSSFGESKHRYKLAPESVLPADIRKAPDDVREAYRFALANRVTLRYIPCYCGCGAAGHTSNASCYFKDSSTPEKPVFDRMSLN
jgi:hypothetical protein